MEGCTTLAHVTATGGTLLSPFRRPPLWARPTPSWLAVVERQRRVEHERLVEKSMEEPLGI
jgi:hypothetical protein